MTAATQAQIDQAQDAINEDSTIVAEVLADAAQWCSDMSYDLDTDKAEAVIEEWIASDEEGFHAMLNDDVEELYLEVYAAVKGLEDTLSDGSKLIEAISCFDQQDYDAMDSLLTEMKRAGSGKRDNTGKVIYKQLIGISRMKAAA